MIKTNKYFKNILTAIFLVGFLVAPYFVFAETPTPTLTLVSKSNSLTKLESIGGSTGLQAQDPRIVIANLIKTALGFIGIIFVVLMLYAGFNYMTAAGEVDKIDTAISTIRRAIIGLIIVMGAYSITAFVTSKVYGASSSSSANVKAPAPVK